MNPRKQHIVTITKIQKVEMLEKTFLESLLGILASLLLLRQQETVNLNPNGVE